MWLMTENTQLSARDEQARRLAETLRRQLGPKLCGLLEAPDVVELMLNADGQVWVDRLGSGMSPISTMPGPTAESLIATVASTIRSTVTRENPILECELPLAHPFDGARFEAVIPPVVSPGPVFTIRRKAAAVFTLDEYVSAGIMTTSQCTAIKRAIRDHKNILVVGGTGTGKTTLTNAILAYIAEVDALHRLHHLIVGEHARRHSVARIQCLGHGILAAKDHRRRINEAQHHPRLAHGINAVGPHHRRLDLLRLEAR